MKDEKVATPHSLSERLMSLDAFRGLVILGMLLVNNIALDTFTPRHLAHAPWNQGVTFADMVFPWFLLIVGVAIPYSAASAKRRGLSLFKYDLKALGRAVNLLLLGCLLDSSIARSPGFSLGILQLIGISYFVAAILFELHVGWRLVLAAGLLLAYWGAIRFLAIPGVGSGLFTEEQNFIKHINQVYLEPFHLKGLLSLIPTSALVLLGTVVGEVLRNGALIPWKKAAALLAGGGLLSGIAWLWSLDLPFNKTVFTPSYILLAAGLGTIVIALFYLLIDVTGWRLWAFPLVVPGTNAILAYVLPILVKVYILQLWTWKKPDGSLVSLQQAFMDFCFQRWGRVEGGWLYTLFYIGVWWLVFLVFYRKKIFLRV